MNRAVTITMTEEQATALSKALGYLRVADLPVVGCDVLYQFHRALRGGLGKPIRLSDVPADESPEILSLDMREVLS